MGERELISGEVRQQYESFPYPPIPRLALPRRDQGEGLSFELGTRLAYGSARGSESIRILVAGCGSFEPLVVAARHPRAAEVVAVDLSDASLRVLGQRLAIARWVGRRRLAPVRRVCADLAEWNGAGEGFDFILASNLLQHVPEPGRILARLAGWLRPGGVLRMVVYPRQSRIWMREASRWLRWHGLSRETPHLRSRARACIELLPALHPARLAFETQPETGSDAGIVDAFLNAWEEPPSPREWAGYAASAGLRLVGETQHAGSRSEFLDEIVPEIGGLGWSRWEKLQVLDDLLELCANPVLWLVRGEAGGQTASDVARDESAAVNASTGKCHAGLEIISPVRFEIAEGLRRVESQLGGRLPLSRLRERFAREVGPRVGPPPGERLLPGLSVVDYDWDELLALPRPLSTEAWRAVTARLRPLLGDSGRLAEADRALAGETDHMRQVEWIGLRYGWEMSRIRTSAELFTEVNVTGKIKR